MTDQQRVMGEKRAQRSVRWELNLPWLFWSLAIALLVFLVAIGLYWFQSQQITSSILAKADQARENEDWEKQLLWLSRYRLLDPTNTDALVAYAKAANLAADAPPANRLDQVERSRKSLRDALASLADQDSTPEIVAQQAELRRLLIKRLMQYGPRYADEAERQIVLLAAPNDDVQMLRAMAFARIGQSASEQADKREPDKFFQDSDFWLWLSQQPLGVVTSMAWQANPTDIGLATSLIDQCIGSPELFGSTETGDAIDPTQMAKRVIEQLQTQTQNGQAQWVIYRYLQQTQPKSAGDHLQKLVPPALKRLQDHVAQLSAVETAALTTTESANESSPAIPAPILSTASAVDLYEPRWDYDLVLESTQPALQSAATQEIQVTAGDRLDALMAMPDMAVPSPMVESAYVSRGRLYWNTDETEQAISIWKDGIERLGDNSLNLQLIYTGAVAEKGTVAEASESADRLADLVRRQSLALMGPEGARYSQSERTTFRKQLDTATWMTQLIRGQIALREGHLSVAIDQLQTALDSQFPISDSERVRAAILLAQAFEKRETWDLAATAYERAISLSPADNQFRVNAARAWALAGDSNRSRQQWQAIDGASIPLLIARAQALLSVQMSLPPAKRDFVAINRSLETIREQLRSVPDDQEKARSELQAQLELLTLAIPDSDDGQQREQAIERLESLSDRFPQSAQMQSVAALTLASAGRPERSEAALNRLLKIVGTESYQYQQTLARTLVARGMHDEAVRGLVEHAKAVVTDADVSLTLAADIAQVRQQNQLAYQLLQQIPETQLTADTLFRLFSLSLTQGAKPTANEADGDRIKDAMQWENKLKKFEGDDGAWWRLARASRLMYQWDRMNENDPKRYDLIKQASELQTFIRNARPRWGMGLALEGYIAARQGEPIRAIDALRRGIDSGDRRVSSILLLIDQLNKANRVAEADAELMRFESIMDTDSNLTALAVAIAAKKGDYTQGLELARAGANSNPHDTSVWLILGQTAARAAQATEQPDARKKLVGEAKNAYDRALSESNDSSLAAYQLRVRLQATFYGNKEVRLELQQALKSNVSEPMRSLFVGLAYSELKDFETALPILQRAVKIAPNDPDVFIALAEFYRLGRDDAKSIEMLEKAYSLAPTRTDVRNKLALAVALRDGAEVPWQRLDQLLRGESGGTDQNELLHALILINRGDEKRQEQAAQILNELIRVGGPVSDDAMRMLAALERRRWLSGEPESDESRRAFAEARRLYTALTRRPNPAPMDLYRFADLLLRADQTTEVEGLADKLDAITGGSPIGLDIRLRLAKKLGQEEKAAELAKQWAQQAVESGTMLQAGAWETTGRTLSNLGYHDQALEWLERAYDENPDTFRVFVIALSRARKFDRAIEICKTNYKSKGQPDAVALLADVMIISGDFMTVPEEIEAIFTDALAKHESVPRLVESIGSLRLAQERYPESVALYERAIELAPDNGRILNNLAMALSEIPGREPMALPRIRKAIDLYGRSPELLDTQGLVLLRNDKVDEATKVLREAMASSDDPRYRFHLLMALMRSGDKVQSRAVWAQLDVTALKTAVLTPAERRDFALMQEQFGARRTP
ncbi:tetratricopeptide repeat protein [Stieleria varia]|uniref:Tetratricopeptide repeat protein n=1 Tax=Stieleria varia TaxID=2528005 RepID=A0A5C6AP18_9BACT|nr:tetratricopeptide repeat protein [Stieleria varia]TWU01257.1 Tetratricopeptide repeat protein [Stieleria varia]